MAEDEAAVYDFVTELTTARKVSDETYAQAKRVFNDQQIVDLTAVAGNYIMVAMLLAMSERRCRPARSRRSGRVRRREFVIARSASCRVRIRAYPLARNNRI